MFDGKTFGETDSERLTSDDAAATPEGPSRSIRVHLAITVVPRRHVLHYLVAFARQSRIDPPRLGAPGSSSAVRSSER